MTDPHHYAAEEVERFARLFYRIARSSDEVRELVDDALKANGCHPIAVYQGTAGPDDTASPWSTGLVAAFLAGAPDLDGLVHPDRPVEPEDVDALIGVLRHHVRVNRTNLDLEDVTRLLAAFRVADTMRALLADPHYLRFGDEGWSVLHPIRCRPDMTDCEHHRAALRYFADLHDDGTRGLYEFELVDPDIAEDGDVPDGPRPALTLIDGGAS